MSEKQLMSGNEALAEAAIQAGCRGYFGYPITPQNEVCAYMAARMPEVNGQFVQSESEVAAINMVFGAAVVGERAMTSSSSPGISLMQEGISYLAACELPAVIVNVMRGGPGLGNIGPSQADYFQATRGGGHGDYHTIVLAPATVQELVEHMMKAFDYADLYLTPVMVCADGVLGQMVEPVTFPAREEIELPEKEWALTGCGSRDPNRICSLLLGENALREHNIHLQEKYRQIRETESLFEEVETRDADIVLVAYGTPSRPCKALVRRYRQEGYRIGLFRPVTLWPFPSRQLAECVTGACCVLVVEMSSGQLIEDVRLSIPSTVPVTLLGKPGGEVILQEEVDEQLKRLIDEHGLKRHRK